MAKMNNPGPAGWSAGAAVSLSDAGKRFNREWIFRHVTYSFQFPGTYAITGPNGSGKSTLLQVIAASIRVSEGACSWFAGDGQTCPEEAVYRSVAMAAPYLEVIEEMTVTEFLTFHASFKPMLPGLSVPQIIQLAGLEKAAGKQIRYYSSGMKQRVKLAQAVFADTPVLLLDEPCTNLDAAGYALYHRIIAAYCSKKLIIVSSNDALETDFCKEKIHMMDYK